MRLPQIEIIRSGGQAGVDRGALEAALALNLEHHGWCRKGRLAEDGCIPERYRLTEAPSADDRLRLDLNVRDSDATVIICRYPISGASHHTRKCCWSLEKPCLVLELDAPSYERHSIVFDRCPSGVVRTNATARPSSDQEAAAALALWLSGQRWSTLNVVGSRESKAKGITARTERILVSALT